MILFGFSLIFALFALIAGTFLLVFFVGMYVPIVTQWLRSGEWREAVEGWREQVRRLRRIERVDRMWNWFECRSVRGKGEAVDAEELERLGSHDGEGREGSVGGETLFEGEEDEDGGGDGDGQARKEEEMDLESEDYMKRERN